MSAQADNILALVETLLQAGSLEPAVRGAARHLGETTEAVTSGIVIMIHGGVFLEAWYPEMPTRSRDLFQPVRSLTFQTAQNGTGGYMPLGTAVGASLTAHAIPLPLSHRLHAALCVVSFPEAERAGAEECPPLDRLARIIALRLNELVEIEADRRKSQQFERWFRVSDRQIRALDLERQKFAALVNSFSGGAFVTDRNGTISWQSRPLADRAGHGGDSWVGRSCRDLCQALQGADGHCCRECVVARVLVHRKAAFEEFEFVEAGERQVLRLTASPINDLAGQAQEVMVTFQRADLPDRRAAA